jgi:oligopeptide/dipeptide ABC transporter ATP-binding protein
MRSWFMTEELLSVSGLVKEYRNSSGTPIRALDGVDLTLSRGSTLAVVGESGCGKTTLARSILGAVTPTSGSVRFQGEEISSLRGAALRKVRARLGFVQQNPATSLDPRMRVADIIAEPLRAHGLVREGQLTQQVAELADLVSLRTAVLQQRPMELSGGQAQRVAIARAIALRPELIILDEPTSALDLSVQAQVLNLLLELQHQLSLSYLLISHDLDVVEHLSDTIAVMYLGRIVEKGAAEELSRSANHPYTAALFSATPSLDPVTRRERIVLTGDVQSSLLEVQGCSFRSRCWLWEKLGQPAACAESAPLLIAKSSDVSAACHFSEQVALAAPSGFDET